MITHLEPDILESKVKWALGRIMTDKASGGDGIPIKLLRVPKMMLLKCCIRYANKSRREQWPEDWKRSVFIPITKKGSAKECSNYHTVVLILHVIKVMFKILQVRPQQYMNQERPDVQLDSEKAEKPETNCQHPLDHQINKRVPEKHLLLLYGLCQSLWQCRSQQTTKNS